MPVKNVRNTARNHLIGLSEKISTVKYLPRWLVFAIDIFIVMSALTVTFFLMNTWHVRSFGLYNDGVTFGIIFLITAIYLIIFKIYRGAVRHSTLTDIFRISIAVIGTLLTLLAINFGHNLVTGKYLFFLPILFFYAILLFSFLFFFRYSVKFAFQAFITFRNKDELEDILIYGIDESAVALGNSLRESHLGKFNFVGFLSPDSDDYSTRIGGKKIYSFNELYNSPTLLDTINGVIYLGDSYRREEKKEELNQLIQHNIKLYHVPISEIGIDEVKPQIKSVQIEDLLYRDQISIENDEIRKRHSNKVVLVTGGAGSIGSEIVRKVARFSPETIVVVDQAETPLNQIKLEMLERFPNQKFQFHLCNVANKYRMEPLFEDYNFSMVYHAAAYKHVPIVEDNPHEAILVNVMGSRVVADLCEKYRINRFVMVSTDKAVNPTNVMGASKRAAEMYVQALQHKPGNRTKFITTRFGNVLGSNGSVIPIFKDQIEKGGPVTVTHKEITRYFMTIPEACELVLQAGTMGQGGEIYVFDMGEPVKIYDLARKMIQLSGFEPEIDIAIKFTGLRPGEKLYEELLSDESTTLPTHHEMIMRAKVDAVNYEYMDTYTKKIARSAIKADKMVLVRMLKKLVPEFKSKNSTFEALDSEIKNINE